MTKLSELQGILLTTASQRETGSLLPPPSTISNVGARITRALAALTKQGLAAERPTDDAAASRQDGDVRLGLFITAAGLAAIGVEATPDVPNPAPLPGSPSAGEPSAPAQPRATKASLVVELLSRTGGATLAELVAATGWLPHTTRAALTGLRHKGHAIERGKRDTATCYRIAGHA